MPKKEGLKVEYFDQKYKINIRKKSRKKTLNCGTISRKKHYIMKANKKMNKPR